MTYLQFLLVFLVLPIIGVLAILKWKRQAIPWYIGGLSFVALVYTTPWDNFLVLNGVWTYPPTRVLNIVFGAVPLEEYGFFILQTVFTSLLTLAFVGGFASRRRSARSAECTSA